LFLLHFLFLLFLGLLPSGGIGCFLIFAYIRRGETLQKTGKTGNTIKTIENTVKNIELL